MKTPKHSYRELQRLLGRAMYANNQAQVELEKWLRGFIHVSALLKQKDRDHWFLKTLPDSTLQMVEKEYEKLIEGEVVSDSGVRPDSDNSPDAKTE